MNLIIFDLIKKTLLSVFKSFKKSEHTKQLLIKNETEIIDFNLKFVRIGDELKYFRTLKT